MLPSKRPLYIGNIVNVALESGDIKRTGSTITSNYHFDLKYFWTLKSQWNWSEPITKNKIHRWFTAVELKQFILYNEMD